MGVRSFTNSETSNPVRGDPVIREREAITDIRAALPHEVDIYSWPKAGGLPLVNPDIHRAVGAGVESRRLTVFVRCAA